jgi:hypothetical protein
MARVESQDTRAIAASPSHLAASAFRDGQALPNRACAIHKGPEGGDVATTVDTETRQEVVPRSRTNLREESGRRGYDLVRQLFTTLEGDRIVPVFLGILTDAVARTY